MANGEDFLCGVVEGFYSRPWSVDQRLDLYEKMEKYRLNTYIFCPKDDTKHRALWRQLYTDSELQFLKRLIDKCRENNVTFVYGISPGLDISYSKAKEVGLLKAKLDQLKSAGCGGFCLLWDDIETTLPQEDSHAFESLAEAQIAISNQVFAHLGRPLFLFCPTEYCGNRAYPNVKNSNYLQSLGKKLDKEIKVFWTGSKVVSEIITETEIKEVGEVLQRKPLIWDNLHANDYDQQRLFLGPFKGRTPNLIPFLSGVMTNPNCEYSFNIPVLYTMGSWYQSHVNSCGEWDSMQASKEAIPHFLAEMKRKTGSFTLDDLPKLNPEDEFSESEVEFLFHLFWLPHSHGPKAQIMLDEFEFLKKHASLMLELSMDPVKIDQDSTESEESNSSFVEVTHSTFVLEWMRRFSIFNESCKKIFRMIDKWTYVANRELFFDINPYLNNLQVILRGCSRYLKWVSLEKCQKPINGGPTLAGLMGGFAGDLQRLYPIQSLKNFPLRTVAASHDLLVVRPLLRKEKSQIQKFLVKMSDSVDQISNLKSMTRVFAASIADQSDCKGYVIEQEKDGVLAFIVATRQISSLLKALKSSVESDRVKQEKFDQLNKNEMLAAFFCTKDLFYSKALRSMFEAFFEAHVEEDNQNFALIVDKYEDLVLSFLAELKMRKTHEAKSYFVVKRST